ncbi:hypothetical protein AV530_009078 [Patagioenas fasciata monilis]|uniref:Uncharacterized protein n=1 Tax=Patagioenas fasciata monilis TaxID=372326 RepID=A0A1V4L0I4_PATFA|nr:hypothetical protein AV530_009078 [Patagioenas fasciata monilis]
MLKKVTILSVLLALILVDLLMAQDTTVATVLEATSVEESRDPSLPLSTELPLDYSTDPHKEEGTSQVGNTGVQEGEQTTWELSGEPSTESAPELSVEPSKEPAQKSTTEISALRIMSALGELEVIVSSPVWFQKIERSLKSFSTYYHCHNKEALG